MIAAMATGAFGEIAGVQFEPKPFDENSYTLLLSDSMMQIEPKQLESQSYDFAFKDKTSRFEVRYTMFSEKGSVEDPRAQVSRRTLN